MKTLAKIYNSDTLKLQGNKLGKDGMKGLSASLRRHSNLEKLFLDNNELGDDAMLLLAEN